MAVVTVRDIPAATWDVLVERAAGSGLSVEQYLRAELIQMTARPMPADVLGEIRARARAHAPRELDALLDEQDRDRR